MSDIEIRNTGPVEKLTIPIPKDGGVVVLTGPNGAGKDLSINAIKAALGGKQRLTAKDGAKFGSVELPGVSLRITSSVRRKGEAEVASIRGDLDYSQFVNPMLKDPAAADRERISLLCKIHGVEADRAAFYDLVGGEAAFNRIASAKTLKAENLVDMAKSLKSDLEAYARTLEDRAKVESGRAVACDDSAAGVDLEAACGSEFLQGELEAALRKHAMLTSKVQEAESSEARRRTAILDMENAKGAYIGPTYDECLADQEVAKAAMDSASAEVARIQKELLEARQRASEANIGHGWAMERARAAKQHEDFVAECERTIQSATSITPPSATEVDEAANAIDMARERLEHGAVVRKARQSVKEAKMHRENAATLEMSAEDVRGTAKDTLSVLASKIGGGTFSLAEDEKGNARFVVTHPTRGQTYFSELSDGEAWSFVFTDGIELLRSRGYDGDIIFPLEQRSWESLDAANKAIVAKAAVDAKVTVITATSGQELDALGNVIPLHCDVISK